MRKEKREKTKEKREMKTQLILCIALCLCLNSQAQKFKEEPNAQHKSMLTVGFLNGGGSLIGADLEYMLTKRVGMQVGGGLIGFGGGINYHLQPAIQSSFVSLQYWHQGVGPTHSMSLLGPSYVYRSKKWFTCQLGFGVVMDRGKAMPEVLKNTTTMFTYSIGAMLPF